MTARSSTRRVVVASLLCLPVVIGAAGPAVADPPAFDARCAILLARVATWPGDGIPGGAHFSDAYERHLLGQPACRAR
jgi:hypothetical protein